MIASQADGIDLVDAHLRQALDVATALLEGDALSADDVDDLRAVLGAGAVLLRHLRDGGGARLSPTLQLVEPAPRAAAPVLPPAAPPPVLAAPPSTSAVAWGPLLAAFETHLLAAGRAFGTAKLRDLYLRQLAAEHPDPRAICHADLEAYMAARRATLKAQTRRSLRSSLMQFFRWAVEAGHLAEDPAAKLAPVRATATVPRVALDVDVQKALDDLDPRDRAVVLLARLGCLRRAEIASLRIEQRTGAMLLVLGKGEKERRVPLDRVLIAALEAVECGRTSGYYFPGRSDGHTHVSTVYQAIRRATGWNPHALRHAGATAGYRTTHDLRAVQELLGHASISTTQGYLHVDEDSLRAVAAGTSSGLDLA